MNTSSEKGSLRQRQRRADATRTHPQGNPWPIICLGCSCTASHLACSLSRPSREASSSSGRQSNEAGWEGPGTAMAAGW